MTDAIPTDKALRRVKSAADADGAIDRIAGLFPPLDDTEARIALAIYRLLARTDRAEVSDIARQAGTSPAAAAGAVAAWPGVFRAADGAVIGFWGLTGRKMAHEMVIDGRQRFTWCAWDALFIPHLLGRKARVRSATPVHGRRVELEVGPDGATPLNTEAAPAAVSFLLPTTDGRRDNVLTSFCRHVLFLCADEVAPWLARNPGGIALDLDAAFRAGVEKNRRQFAEGLD